MTIQGGVGYGEGSDKIAVKIRRGRLTPSARVRVINSGIDIAQIDFSHEPVNLWRGRKSGSCCLKSGKETKQVKRE